MCAAGGYNTANQAWVDFGKKAALSGAVAVISVGAGALSSAAAGITGVGGVLIRGEIKSGELMANKGVSSLINSVNYKDGVWAFDGQVFCKPMR